MVIEEKVDPIREEARRGQGIVTKTSGARPGVLTGINHVDRYKDCYPLTAVVYWLYPIREPDQASLAPMRRHFEVPLR